MVKRSNWPWDSHGRNFQTRTTSSDGNEFISCIKRLACAPQAGAGAQPKRRYGLLGLMKRNKSEIGRHSLVPTMFKRFHAHVQQEVHSQPIAEDGVEDDDHNDLFASPR